MPSTVGYWNIRGLVAPIRYLLEHVGEEYEFKAYDRQKRPEEWQDDKSNDAKLGLEFPNLPYYIDGDVRLSQAFAILRHLGRKHQLTAKNDADMREQDMIENVFNDMIHAWSTVSYEPDDFAQDKFKFREELPSWLKPFEKKILAKRDYVVGDYLTYLDFVLFERIDGLITMFPDLLENYPNIKKHHDRIGSLKGVEEFRQSKRFDKVLNNYQAVFNNV